LEIDFVLADLLALVLNFIFFMLGGVPIVQVGEDRVEVGSLELLGDALLEEVKGRGVGDVRGRRGTSTTSEEAAHTSSPVSDESILVHFTSLDPKRSQTAKANLFSQTSLSTVHGC